MIDDILGYEMILKNKQNTIQLVNNINEQKWYELKCKCFKLGY